MTKRFTIVLLAVLVLGWLNRLGWAQDPPAAEPPATQPAVEKPATAAPAAPPAVAVVGSPAPQFELPDIEGQTHKLADYKGQVVVLHFQSCRCPWDVAYQPILNEVAHKFAAQHEQGRIAQPVTFVAINSNRAESVQVIKEYADEGKITYTVLKDTGNKVADLYKAQTTPHIFIIAADDTQTLVYAGGVEKAPLSPREVGQSREQYLEPVLDALGAGQKLPVSKTQSIGCSIKRVPVESNAPAPKAVEPKPPQEDKE